MEFSRYSLAMAVTTMVTVLIACTLIWLVVSEPVALATAVNDGDVTALAKAFPRKTSIPRVSVKSAPRAWIFLSLNRSTIRCAPSR